MLREIKIAMIGGGGKNIGGTILYLLNSGRVQNIEFALFGRTYKNMERNIALANRIKNHNGCSIKVYDTLESALEGADIVMHCATAGYGEYGGYRSYGVPQGGHVMYVGEKISKLCPDAWVLGATNPPEVPLTALLKRFGIEKSIGLCNAPMIVKNTLSAISGTDEKNILMRGIGLNHDVWYYDFRIGEETEPEKIVDMLNQRIDQPSLSDHPWFRLFPEWRIAIKNNIALLKETGYLLSPAGGTRRLKGLPVSSKEYGAIMKRPSKEDFENCLNEDVSIEDMLRITGRCGGGVPVYTGRIIESILLEDDVQHTALVPNKGAYEDAPDSLHIQADVSFEKGKIVIHGAKKLSDFIKGMLTARFIQNDLLTSALAYQDDLLLKKAIMVMPERYEFEQAITFESGSEKSVEPFIPFN
jgi:alpha-galactosidase/6-phospho-beta-glucosidase family protein